jgi:penicillin-binding protein 2
LPGEAPGLIPTPGWVEKVFKHKWYAGETMSVAIGQGAVVVTPLQLARMIGTVASGGVFCRPHLAFKDQLLALGVDPPDESAQNFPLADSTLDVVNRGMWGVVNEDGGTGIEARCPGIDIGGKTGTAQVASVDLMKSAQNANFKTNAWFVGFAPASRPEIVVAALVLHGGHSTVAVPVAREVIKAYFDKKSGQKPLVAPVQTQERMLSKAGEVQLPAPAVGTAAR